MGALKTISREEVASHNSSESCWIIMNGKVYDVTQFLQEHPGGEEVITELAGKDATEEFKDVGHSRDASEMTNEYLIGELPAEEVAENKPTGPAADTPVAPTVTPKGPSISDTIMSSSWSNIIIPTAIGIVAFICYKGVLYLSA